VSDEPTGTALPVRPIARPQPAERAAAIVRLEDWARERGARFDALALRVDGNGHATAHAARDLAGGEPLVAIPRALILRGASRDALATWLPLEVARPDSPWKPFLDVLPVQLPELPMFRDGAEVRASYALLDDETRARVTLADYAWGRAIVRSRGFNAPNTIEPRVALIPIVDLMDHAPGETTWRYDGARAEYLVTALRPFARGEQVHFDYGDYGNAHLLEEYGFVLADNPFVDGLTPSRRRGRASPRRGRRGPPTRRRG
jgi:hypothetical protein